MSRARLKVAAPAREPGYQRPASGPDHASRSWRYDNEILIVVILALTGVASPVLASPVDDSAAGVDRQPHDPVTRLLGDQRSRHEAVTSVIGYTLPDVIVIGPIAERLRELGCQTRYDDLHEGVVTTAGLLVEMRLRVALVQPEHGPAVWVPVDKLQLKNPRPGCDDKLPQP